MPGVKQIPPRAGIINDAAHASGANDRGRDFLSMSAEQQHDEVQRLIRQAHAARTRLLRATFRRLLLWAWDASTVACNAAGRLSIRASAALGRSRQAYDIRWQRWRAAAQLGSFSDRELKDIGVSRSAIDWVVAHRRDDWSAGAARVARPILLRTPESAGPPVTSESSDAMKRKRAA